MSGSGNDGSAKVAMAYIESLSSRLDSAEKHTSDDIEAIEKRLNQLVDLVKNVSSMQHQVTTMHQSVIELRAAVRGNIAQIEELVNGLEGRYGNHFETVKKKISESSTQQDKARTVLDGRVAGLEDKLRTWLNRGVGAWAVFALVIGLFQFVGMQYINGLRQEKEAIQTSITRLSTRVTELEARRQTLESQLTKRSK